MMNLADKDIAYWQAWKSKPTTDNLHGLLHQMAPVLHSAVKANQGSLAPEIILSEAKVQAVNAFHSFNPKLGVKLSTHVTNALQKVNRLNYKYQEIFEVPEQRRIKFKSYQNAKSHLEDTLGRAPNLDELAHELKWSMAEVKRYQQEARVEYSDSQPYSSDIASHDTSRETLNSYIYNDLTPIQKSLFEHVTGYGGAPKLSNPQLMKKLKLTQGQLSYAKKQLIEVVSKAQESNIRG